ncbi:unnamed protein product, partial [Cyprideis torosa]
MSANPGDFLLPDLGRDLDIRSDIPRYRIYEDGILMQEVTDVQSLIADGLEVRNITEGVNVPMYRTNIACRPAGRFSGTTV